MAKSIAVTTMGPVQNSTPASLKFQGLTTTLLVSNPFFTVYKWDMVEQTTMFRTADYLLVSVLEGQGQLEVAGHRYPIQRGSHFILPHDVESWRLSGQLTLIAIQPNA